MRNIILVILMYVVTQSLGQLPASNLKLSAIIDTLNDISAISLNGVCTSDNVSKYGLNAVYCPGANADERLSNLRTAKVMSYFKLYKHAPYACDFTLTSGGYSPDTVLYPVRLKAIEGVFKLNYQAYNIKDYFDLYDGENIIDGTGTEISGGPYDDIVSGSDFTSDVEYNWPLWYYHDGLEEDTIYIRTYAPDTNTGWNFSGGCPYEAVKGTDYTQYSGITLYFSNLATPFNVEVTPSTDSVYVQAYSIVDDVKIFEQTFDSYTNYQTGYTSTKIAIIAYSRYNVNYTINVTD
jgi:hypothetical protein